MKLSKILTKKFWSIRKIILGVAILLVMFGIFYVIFGRKNTVGSIQTDFVSKQNLEETVLATAQVVSNTDLDLGFQAGGIVRWVPVKEGDKVYQGQVLAVLDQSSAHASLTTAKGSLAQAEANYAKLLAGAAMEDIKIYEDAVASAQHDLDSSNNLAVNILSDAYVKIYNVYTTSTSMQNNYFSASDQEGIKARESRANINSNLQDVKIYLDTAQKNPTNENVDSAISQMLLSLNNVYSSLSIIREQSDSGIYYSKVSLTDKTSLDTQKGYINTALTDVTTKKQNIISYKISLQKAQHQLDLKKAPPMQADIDLAKAQILSAQGQVDSASVALNNLIIVAPSAGTITEVVTKIGEQATAMAKAIVLQDVGNLYAEANVSEANIASLKTGQDIDYTFDALGPDKHFSGKVTTINPASTVISGVVDYKIKGNIENVPNIKPGMTANMTILIEKKDNVLAVPSTAIINKNSKKYVRVVDDSKKITYHEVQVDTGMEADGGLIEIISGLNEGQRIVTYIKP